MACRHQYGVHFHSHLSLSLSGSTPSLLHTWNKVRYRRKGQCVCVCVLHASFCMVSGSTIKYVMLSQRNPGPYPSYPVFHVGASAATHSE